MPSASFAFVCPAPPLRWPTNSLLYTTRTHPLTTHGHDSNSDNLCTSVRDRADILDRQICPTRTCPSLLVNSVSRYTNAHDNHSKQAYALYLRVFYSSKRSQQQRLKSEILANKKELMLTSAQDQFARWAKLRRSVDKGLADLEKLSKLFCVPTTYFRGCVFFYNRAQPTYL